MKHAMRYAFALAAYYSGVHALHGALRRRRSGGRVLILAYHSVRRDLDYCDMFVHPDLLRAQVRALAPRYSFMTVGQIADQLRAGPLARDVAAVTFDDGYRDNLTEAAGVLKSLGVPFTVFLATRHIDTGVPTLFLAVTLIVERTRREHLELPGRQLPRLPLRTPVEREAAIRAVDALGKPLGWDERQRLVHELAAALDVDADSGVLAGQMLDWADVRALAADGVEIGAHSMTHAVLGALDEPEMLAEMRGSVERIEAELRSECRVFAYPYGGSGECGHREFAACGALGLEAAVTLQETDSNRDPLLALGRVMPTRDRSLAPWGGFSEALNACESGGLMRDVRRFLRS